MSKRFAVIGLLIIGLLVAGPAIAQEQGLAAGIEETPPTGGRGEVAAPASAATAPVTIEGTDASGRKVEAIVAHPTTATQVVVIKEVRVERLVMPARSDVSTRTNRRRVRRTRKVYGGPRISGTALVNLLRKQGFFATQEQFSKLSSRVDGLQVRVGKVEEGLKAATGRLNDHEARLKALEGGGVTPPPATPTPSLTPTPAPPTAPAPSAPSGGLQMTPAVFNRGSVWENAVGPGGEPIARLRLAADEPESAAANVASPLTEMTITVTGRGEPLAGVEILVFQDDTLKGSQRTGAKGQMKLADPSGLGKYAIALGSLPGGWRTDGTSKWQTAAELTIDLVSAAADHNAIVGQLDRIEDQLEDAAAAAKASPKASFNLGWILLAFGLLLAVSALTWKYAPGITKRPAAGVASTMLTLAIMMAAGSAVALLFR